MTPHIGAAVVVYLLIPLGIVLFALPRVSPEHLVSSALLWGFLFGIVLYGVYDMTNYSVLAKWPIKLVVVDIKAKKRLGRPVTLAEIKALPAFEGSPLVRQGRLSVVPLTAKQWKTVEEWSRT